MKKILKEITLTYKHDDNETDFIFIVITWNDTNKNTTGLYTQFYDTRTKQSKYDDIAIFDALRTIVNFNNKAQGAILAIVNKYFKVDEISEIELKYKVL